MPVYPSKRNHVHGEAFCLMTYRSDDGFLSEILWNSRDGVTPFVISSVDGRKLTHVDWEHDKYSPDFKPPSGMRVFVNATKELVTPKLNEYIDKIWDDPTYPASKRWETKQECFDALLPDWLHGGEAPWIIVTP